MEVGSLRARYGLIRFRTDICTALIALQFYVDINITPMVDFKCVKDRHDIGLYVKEKYIISESVYKVCALQMKIFSFIWRRTDPR